MRRRGLKLGVLMQVLGLILMVSAEAEEVAGSFEQIPFYEAIELFDTDTHAETAELPAVEPTPIEEAWPEDLLACSTEPAEPTSKAMLPTQFSCETAQQAIVDAVRWLQFMEKHFPELERAHFPLQAADGYASVEDFRSAAKAREAFLELLRERGILEGQKEISDQIAALRFWSTEENWLLLTAAYDDRYFDEKRFADEEQERVYASRKDIRWMLGRLEILESRCRLGSTRTTEERTCCRCTFDAGDEKFCNRAPTIVDGAPVCPERENTLCAYNRADERCHSAGWFKCEGYKSARAMGGSCDVVVSVPVEFPGEYGDYHHGELTECTIFRDRHEGHSYHHFFGLFFPERLASARIASPGLRYYDMQDRGCMGFTDGNCSTSHWHYSRQIKRLLSESRIDLEALVTANQDISLTRHFLESANSMKQCMSPLSLRFRAASGYTEVKPEYVPCKAFFGQECQTQFQQALCMKDATTNSVGLVECTKEDGALRWR